mmetsp:Transcript_20646/g.48166  ORF Transcript_20646/g.48166 Transcript_20646/m.48166 type:complete len:312 (-) Transcript_20646:282-1217(-)
MRKRPAQRHGPGRRKDRRRGLMRPCLRHSRRGGHRGRPRVRCQDLTGSLYWEGGGPGARLLGFAAQRLGEQNEMAAPAKLADPHSLKVLLREGAQHKPVHCLLSQQICHLCRAAHHLLGPQRHVVHAPSVHWPPRPARAVDLLVALLGSLILACSPNTAGRQGLRPLCRKRPLQSLHRHGLVLGQLNLIVISRLRRWRPGRHGAGRCRGGWRSGRLDLSGARTPSCSEVDQEAVQGCLWLVRRVQGPKSHLHRLHGAVLVLAPSRWARGVADLHTSPHRLNEILPVQGHAFLTGSLSGKTSAKLRCLRSLV